MLKRKLKDVSKELENVKKAREKFENQMKEVEEIKGVLLKFGEGMGRIVKVLESNEKEIDFHKKVILDTINRVEKIEKKAEPDGDVSIA